ncbi:MULTISPECIES: tyrosine-type recombinase/integrase [Comamonadaceae]|jgi:integrase|uniref:tyrosine-type recombinase/integrase n=1 Tax=Comamonadaceae TaxID=80864 RepID=UPI00086A6462|nr:MULTISPECIES: tyrosine-type recombinase/integrase [Comamonadaceae]MDQ7743184.1 tyrosine-type recombinase/integrase [Hydrogenophaga pseudoflava]ODS92222.1 MAG: integrase [Comamonas sp. SCN 65-56]WHZ10741.1 MAG: Integrase [Burkholderiaceae bacterium]
MAKAAATSTGFPGVEVRGNSIRVFFMYKRDRHAHTLPLEPTRNNIKHADQLRSAALFALRNGTYNEADFFPHSRSAASLPLGGKRVGELCDRYKPLKAVDITPETQSRYEVALDICVDTLGRTRMVDALLPEDIQKLRVDLIATRAVSTVNHYLATFSGFLYWCENNHYCGELGKHCVRFTKSIKDPDPLTYEEYLALIEKGCLHPIDKAAVTVAVYTGLRPGELCALAVEDVAPDFSHIKVRRSVTQSVTFKVPKTKKERTVLLQPPAREALKVLVADAEQRETADLTVWLNRHESRIDHVRVLLSPKTQARKAVVNDYFVPSAWNTKWGNLIRRAEIRARPAYQTRHTFACWNLTARGNLAFIANQMGHKDYSMLVTVYGRWIDTESSRELERIWEGMQNMARITPKLHQEAIEESVSC